MPSQRLNIKRIPTLINYKDFLRKAIYDHESYSQTHGVYELADCLLTLNSLPEWIRESDEADDNIKELAAEKILIMQGKAVGFVFDEFRLNEIDQQLRFIRVFCNHAKHAGPKQKLPRISMSTSLPATLPITFDYIEVGNTTHLALDLIKDIINFWTSLITLED